MRDKSDEELLHLLRNGDSRAFAALYERYKSGLYNFCARFLNDSTLAEDAVHEAFATLYTRAGSIAQGGAVRGWLYAVARNEALMMLRRRRNGQVLSPDSVWDDDNPLKLMEQRDIEDTVRSVLAGLKTEYREVILLREFDGLSYADIAGVTGDSESSVKSRLFKARKALAAKLAPWWQERERT